MSFLSDAFEGHWSNLGNDLSHAGSSLMHHPSELYETLGGAAALATGGLALGALPELGAAGAAAEGGGLFGGGADAAGGALVDSGLTNAAGESLGLVDPLAQGSAAASGATPAGFAATDAELSGGITGAGGAAPSGGGLMDSIANSTLLSPSKWTLPGVAQAGGALAAGAGLGMNMLHGNKTDPNQQMLSNQAALESQQGQQLMSYLRTGKLPPALQAQLTQATNAEKARIIANHAKNGQSTDPSQNSALAQELNSVETNAVAAMAQVQMEMLNTGLKETGMSTQIYEMLTKLDMQQNDELMKSIMNFAAALGGGLGGSPMRRAA